jgi:SAM-dependent methyltransferase
LFAIRARAKVRQPMTTRFPRLARLYRQARGLRTTIRSPFFAELQARWPTQPSMAAPVSQLCTAAQFDEPVYAEICSGLKEAPRLHRKQWELVYICRALAEAGMLRPGRRGLVFGVGREKLPSRFVAQGCRIVATDQPPGRNVDRYWVENDQHADSLDKLFFPGLASRPQFYRNASFRQVDMKALPDDLTDFDFCWSACALEHLGSLDLGLRFIRNSVSCLKPGGVAVHTTEFNLGSSSKTWERGKNVVYREPDLVDFAAELRRNGHEITLNLHPGTAPKDLMIDRDNDSDIHLRLYIGYRVLSTSIGLSIKKMA